MEEKNKLNDGANDGENSQDSEEKKSDLSQTGSNQEETNSQIDESSQLSQDNESKEEPKDSVEEEKFDDTEINAKNLEILQNDINYGIVLAFMDKFGKNFSFKEIKFEQFENSLINIRNLNKNLSDFLLNLLKNLSFGKYVKKEKFDYYMTKFVGRFCENDALEIEKNGYIKLKIEAKIIIIKNLLESQFDENQKLKQIIVEQTPDQNSLRTEPNGKDLNGLWYFVYMDSDCSIRVFTINYKDLSENSTSWKLEAKSLDDLKYLVEKLSSQPEVAKLRSSKKYQENMKKNSEKSQSSGENKLDSDIKEELADKDCLNGRENEHDEGQVKEEHKLEIKETSEIKAEIKIENENEEPKFEKIESNEPTKEENEEKTPHKNDKESEDKIEIELEPIALRKSTRSSVRKMQQVEQLKVTPKPKANSNKSTPKSTKKSTKKVPKKKSTKQKSSTIEYIEDDVDDEELEDEDDDEEFALSPSKKKSQISVKKKSRQKNKPNLLDYESGSTISDECDQESACIKCKKVKSKQILILCDGCDAPYHIGCLKPPLLEIPEGDWFCDICSHDKLISYLEQKIELIEKHKQELEASKLAKQNQKPAYTDISAYLDNLFSSNVGRKIKNDKPKKSIFEETVLDGPRSCRLKSRVRYTFEDFDKSINQACGEEEDEEEQVFEPRPTRRSSRLNEYVDNCNSEVESDAGSNSSEYKASIKRPKYESEEISEEEPESDEDFKASKKKRRSERVTRKKSKKSNKRKTKSKYCDDTESDVEETEEEEEEELVYSDDEEVNKERSSRGKLKVLQKWSDDESAKTSDQEYSNDSSLSTKKKRSTRTKSNKNYCESSDENDIETESKNEEKPTSRIKKPWVSDDEEDEMPAKKARPIIKRPWSDDDSNEAKSQPNGAKQNEKSEIGQKFEENKVKNLPTNVCTSSVNVNKSQVMLNEAQAQITVENKPINTLQQANFVPNTFITSATPLVYYYCQPTHIQTLQPTPVIQMNGQIPNQLQPIVLMNIPSQGFMKPS